MADFFFFTDIDLLNNQISSQAFGAAGNVSSADQYRTTSLHSSSGSPRAYAMCDGSLCIQQDQSNASLINLILKPEKNPEINFSKIKYVIYKGILKSSLLDGSGNVVINPNNDLTASIKRSWDAYLLSTSAPSSLPPEESLGINLNASVTNYSDSDLIDNLFYRESVTFQLPTVSGGWLIGDFSPSLFGLEIIIENIGYDPVLKLGRNLENFIIVPDLPAGYTNVQYFQYWHKKEEILNFVDPCAFYGSFYSSKIKARTFAGSFDSKSGNDIYDELLKGTQNTAGTDGSFFNRNKTYIDIRNDNNQSINYYKNYGNDIQVAYDSTAVLSVADYYQSGWPLLVLDNSAFPTGNTSSDNLLRLSFPQEFNTKPLVYISQGFRHFSVNTFRRLKNKKKFVELTYIESSFFTDELHLAVPNNSGAGDTTIISSVILLRYIKQIDEGQYPVQAGSITQRQNAIDNLFAPFNMRIPFSASPGIRLKVFEEETFVNKSFSKDQFTARVGIAEDMYNITLFAYAKDIRKNSSIGVGKPILIVSEKTKEEDYFVSLLNKRTFKNQLSSAKIQLASSDVDYLTFSSGSFLEHGLEKISRAKSEEIVILTIDKSSFNAMQGLLATNNVLMDYKVYIGAGKVDTLLDEGNQEYTVFEIVLRGFIDNSGNLEMIEIPTNEKMYSHDNI
ncbi:MAG: hypothetical protein JWO44_1233 [Bacteroidetes bacterium]|nr:hypothetical protein [Bacteroidota bacterium]